MSVEMQNSSRPIYYKPLSLRGILNKFLERSRGFFLGGGADE